MSSQALYQRLKELDRDQFEKLCFHLLKAKYPLANVRHVEGKAGDEGIDSYAGRFDGKLVIGSVRVLRTEWVQISRAKYGNL
jgi:hypothetical protein